jgi:hypothetical protein
MYEVGGWRNFILRNFIKLLSPNIVREIKSRRGR